MTDRETIIKMIEQSTDEGIKGNKYREEEYLQKLLFGDIMAVVFYYISLQRDIDGIGEMHTDYLYHLLKKESLCWAENNKDFELLKLAWSNESGPMGGTAGDAEMYMSFFPGISTFHNLRNFFYYPKRTGHGWEAYRDGYVKNYVFPKWRRNIKKINQVFDFAEIICEEIRKNLKTATDK